MGVQVILVRVFPSGLATTYVGYELTVKLKNTAFPSAFRLRFYAPDATRKWEPATDPTHRFKFILVIVANNPTKAYVDGNIYSPKILEEKPVWLKCFVLYEAFFVNRTFMSKIDNMA